ncbi:SDR family NAD(P)-dependent oxidoreductase [Streptomyces sp. NBC_01334]|uniref:SDR family NAD(P)-dependent oxidoreductase n=1 Tax=Streptomyces sp. NBC_01334 TaxID=2903827 RepID=UPI002E13162F|nr:SDR family NAD(P)-dependent oxidoreductase [Streptomyces sp. NBC_01334]
MEIKGKKAVVFGGASGMGRATAELLAARGADVAVLDRPASAGEEVAAALGGSFHPVDVTDFEATGSALDAAVAALGALHVSVTTAGGGSVRRTLGKDGPHDLETFRRVLDLNAVATFNISRLAAAHMSRNAPEDPETTGERGVIVNTSSIAAFEGQIGQVAYSAAKAAIAAMSLTMARDLGSLGIRVVAIAPSLFETGATERIPAEKLAALVRDAAFPRRPGRPEEYARLALAIIDNPMLNGQCLRLDAGQRFGPK